MTRKARKPRVYRTGHSEQFTIKAAPAVVEEFYAIAEREGWVLGETLERAVAALNRELDSGKKDSFKSPSAAVLLFVRHMTNSNTPAPNEALQRDPDDRKTSDEPMTPAQRSYLETLGTDVGEDVPDDLTKAEASKKIDELRSRSPRVSET